MAKYVVRCSGGESWGREGFNFSGRPARRKDRNGSKTGASSMYWLAAYRFSPAPASKPIISPKPRQRITNAVTQNE